MNSVKIIGLGIVALALIASACDDSSSSSGGIARPDGGIFTTDSGGGGDGGPVVQNECVPPTAGPTTHPGGVDNDETWTAAASPHVLPYDTTIYKTVTLEPCAEVLLAEGRQVTVRGNLLAQGTPTRRIHIGAKDAGKAFANLRTLGAATMRLAYATIDGGGSPLATLPYLAGTLQLQGDLLKPTQELLFVDHVTIDGSLSNGIVLTDNAGFAAGSDALTVKGSAAHPISIFARSVGGVPAGAYVGNAKDQILLPATSNNETINETTTLHDRGVPYLVGHATSAGDLRVDVPQGQPGVTLTVEPGVTMRFKKGGVLRVAAATSTSPARGSLVAVGSATKPIVFTSDEAAPASGDWLGLRFGDVPTAVSRLDYVRVEHAGGTSTSGSDSCPDNTETNNDAAIRISGPPPSAFITNTTIAGSLTNGIDRGYRSDIKIDFLGTNTFVDVTLCNQTLPKDANGACPAQASVPCPK